MTSRLYVCYIQLVSLQTEKIFENETYFHYFSERLQLLHFCGHPCLQRIEKTFLLFPKPSKISELFHSLGVIGIPVYSCIFQLLFENL